MRIDKTGGCVVEVQGATIYIVDSGGIDNHITWTLSATDSCDKTTEKNCEIVVESKK